MTSKFDCFGPGCLAGFFAGFLKWVYPKNAPSFFGYMPGCPNPESGQLSLPSLQGQ